MNMIRMCLNWKVVAALAAVGVGVWVVAPGAIAPALPLLLLAACPLSMAVMMWAMRRGDGAHGHMEAKTDEPQPAGQSRGGVSMPLEGEPVGPPMRHDAGGVAPLDGRRRG